MVSDLHTRGEFDDAAEDGCAQDSSRLRVLIVDDSDLNRNLLHTLLTGWDVLVEEACDGRQAVDLVCRDDTPRAFDFVLMDVTMPVMDGLEATKRIRSFEHEHPEHPGVPVVAYTGGTLRGDPKTLEVTGLNAVLRKPSSPQAIRDCLSTWCAEKFNPAPVPRPGR
jgi:CheY-like chemotaxis protein